LIATTGKEFIMDRLESKSSQDLGKTHQPEIVRVYGLETDVMVRAYEVLNHFVMTPTTRG
jgi:hypothetical protein